MYFGDPLVDEERDADGNGHAHSDEDASHSPVQGTVFVPELYVHHEWREDAPQPNRRDVQKPPH